MSPSFTVFIDVKLVIEFFRIAMITQGMDETFFNHHRSLD